MPLYHTALTLVDINETKRYAGLTRCPEFSLDLLKQACTEAQLLALPKGSWHIYNYCPDTATIMAPAPLELTGMSIKKHLLNCQQVAIMSVTIGSSIEQAITSAFEQGNYTTGLLLDAAATTAVEEVADQLNNFITTQATQKGYITTSRFSPGYGDWSITTQHSIAALAGAQDIGITVTETSMLLPRKSVTAIIGFLPRSKAHQQTPLEHHSCTDCTQIDCLIRRN